MACPHRVCRCVAVVCVALLAAWLSSAATAALQENQVLVIYNSQSTVNTDPNTASNDSVDIKNYYQSLYPNALALDLNDASLLAGNISYADYDTKIRQKVLNYITTNNLQNQVMAITLTKGLPHRIQDLGGSPNAGDAPASAQTLFNNGNLTYATVDSELTLLQFNLAAGNGAGFDSAADQAILNPYHGSTSSITSFTRTAFTSKTLENFGNANALWRLRETTAGNPLSTAGAMFLVTRLDGNTVADVINSLDRSQNITFNRLTDRIIIDENNNSLLGGNEVDDVAMFSPKASDPAYKGNDYDDLAALLTGQYDTFTHDKTSAFLIGATATGTVPDANKQSITGPVAALVTLGGNHTFNDNQQANYLNTFNGQLVDGAILLTAESYGARPFGGLPHFLDFGSLAQWLANGGTLGIGNAWEPFAFSLADSELLMNAFLFEGLTWAEAAWAAIPYLSWQHVVMGDPLARATIVIPEPTGLAALAALGVVLLRRSRRAW